MTISDLISEFYQLLLVDVPHFIKKIKEETKELNFSNTKYLK